MKSRIKQITLLDGKQLFYPSEEELLKLKDRITTIIVEETLTVNEFHKEYHCVECMRKGVRLGCTAI